MGNQNDQPDERQSPEKQVKGIQVLLRLDEQMTRQLDEIVKKTGLGNNRAEVVREILKLWIADPSGLLKYANTRLATQEAMAKLKSVE
jgi:Arc/MetJ-type ribon-helix-helix transcriptional regulator